MKSRRLLNKKYKKLEQVTANFKKTYEIDVKRFNKFYQKQYPFISLTLPKLQGISILLIMIVLGYCKFTNIPCNENFIVVIFLLICSMVYFNCVIVDFILGMYVISYANSPITSVFVQKTVQVGSSTAKLGIGFAGDSADKIAQIGYTAISNTNVLVNFLGFEPTPFSNWWNTRPWGRGYDYEVGNHSFKVKGEILHGVLGNDLMKHGVEKQSPETGIVTPEVLHNIINDPEYMKFIWARANIAERTLLNPSFNFRGIMGVFIEPKEKDILKVMDTKEVVEYPRRLVLPRLLPSLTEHRINLNKDILQQNLLENKLNDLEEYRQLSKPKRLVLIGFLTTNPFLASFLIRYPNLWYLWLID